MSSNDDDTNMRLNAALQPMLPVIREIVGPNVGFCGFIWNGATCYFVKSDHTADAECIAITEGMLKLWGVVK